MSFSQRQNALERPLPHEGTALILPAIVFKRKPETV
jgi:hypothetical protein